MKLWETYFRLWKNLGECLSKGTKESELLKEKPVQTREHLMVTPKRELYCDCGDSCSGDFRM